MRNKWVTLAFCLLLAVILGFKYQTPIKEWFGFKEFVMTTKYGDRFLIKSIDDLLGESRTYKLYYLSPRKTKKTFLLELMLKEFGDFSYQYKDNQIRAYIIDDYIIYAKNHETDFKAILVYKADLKKQRSLIPVAKYFLYDRYFPIIMLVAENLVKSGDPEAINTFKKYAAGEFTAEQKKVEYQMGAGEISGIFKKIVAGKRD